MSRQASPILPETSCMPSDPPASIGAMSMTGMFDMCRKPAIYALPLSGSARLSWDALKPAVLTANLNSDIMVMQSRENGPRADATDLLDGARNWCILGQ